MSEKFGFLIVPDFAFYGLFPALEALRVANYNSSERLYEWCVISSDGRGVVATNGMTPVADHSVADCPPLSSCFVVAGNHPLDNCPPVAIKWLRRIDRLGTRLGAFDSGIFLLAAAGLLDGHVAAVHWEILPIIRENYPSLRLTDQLYNVDARRMTCAGGTSTTDLILAVIAAVHGDALADKVAKGLVHWPRRAGSERQYPAIPPDATDNRADLNDVIAFMHDNIDDPAGIGVIAAKFGLSQRLVEGLFRRHLNTVPSTYYRDLRLKRAQEYLFYSRMSVNEITAACGFSSPTVFCRAFKKASGLSPMAYRRSVSVSGLQRLNHAYGTEGAPQIDRKTRPAGTHEDDRSW